MQLAVSELEREFPGRLVAHNVDATTPDAVRVVGELGFRNHGLVIRSADGKTLWKQPDHQVDMDAVRGAVRELVNGRTPAPPGGGEER